MTRYLSQRHKRIMDESERALFEAASSPSLRTARIAGHVISDIKIHRIWESKHADLVRPVAEESRRAPQLIELRKAEARLTHKRALIDYVRKHQVNGSARDRLFAAFYGPREITNAILSEHRKYMVAVSSRISTDYLLDLMCDPVSKDLVSIYEKAYDQYFELYCFAASAEGSVMTEAIRGAMGDVAQRAKRIRKRLGEARPDTSYSSFDRQALLASTGRHRALNYLNR
jgi:hypothetical protein